MLQVPSSGKGRPLITAYGAGGFRFGLESGDKRIEGSVLILADEPEVWGPRSLSDLNGDGLARYLAPIVPLSGKVEFVLFGSGPDLVSPPPGLRDQLSAARIGLEMMATPAACRTYNHLASEGRHFAVAMLPIA